LIFNLILESLGDKTTVWITPNAGYQSGHKFHFAPDCHSSATKQVQLRVVKAYQLEPHWGVCWKKFKKCSVQAEIDAQLAGDSENNDD
jgi:hypothetical protein